MYIYLDRSSHIPIYRQIHASVRAMAEQGTLRPGDRIPSTRQLGLQLGINRMTVDAAFNNLKQMASSSAIPAHRVRREPHTSEFEEVKH